MGNTCSSVKKCCRENCCNCCCSCCEDYAYTKPQVSGPDFVWSKEDDPNKPNGIPALPTLPKDSEDVGGDMLKVIKVDLNILGNGKAHHTCKYDLMQTPETAKLVTRRGQEFFIDIYFNRPFDKDRDGVSFVFTIADGKASMSQGTIVLIPLLSKPSALEGNPWTAFIEDIDESRIKAQLKVSSKCPIGTWKIAIDTRLQTDTKAVSFPIPFNIYILFNPWSSADQVYLEEEDARNEYVLEDTGLIWRGSHNRLRPTPWAYSQFEKDVLDCALYLLSGPARLTTTARADPVKVSRALSAAVNSPDDDGLVQGNWTDNFDNGVPPTKWTGSGKIVQKYFNSKKPVNYGQCWVFGGVYTTIARALGIPCRPVTNYSSAHDTQASLTVDYFLDKEGKSLETLNTDSVWNFHVWNEVWFSRPDLEERANRDYSGWQAVDSTPQEKSDEMYRCGPASVAAIKRGEILRPFDGPFVFSEVNADKVYWLHSGSGKPLKLLGKKPEGIGMAISTKAIGKFEREDITDSYKYPEKSAEERETMLHALKLSENLFSRYYLNEEFNDVRFDLILIDDIIIGSPFRVLLKVNNLNTSYDYDVKITLRVDAMHYTGKVKKEVKKEEFDIKVPANSDEEVTLNISYDDYNPKLCSQCSFNVGCLAKVKETTYEYFAQDDFRVRKPDIKFLVPAGEKEDVEVGETFSGWLMLRNPLPVSLTKCQFLIESPGMGLPTKINIKGSVKPGELAEAKFELNPRLPGEKTISAKFTSKELEDVDGFVTITVNPSNDIPNELLPLTTNELE